MIGREHSQFGDAARFVEAEFDVGGARDAIGRVYTSCQDTSPVTPAA